MNFNDVLSQHSITNVREFCSKVSLEKVRQVLAKKQHSIEDFLVLVSPAAKELLEEMAQIAHKITLQYFGKTIGVYIPLYLANYCESNCVYCGFSSKNKIKRSMLSLTEVEDEMLKIAETEMKHILLLTGESPNITSRDYLLDCVKIAKKYFSSISIEMFPMKEDSYAQFKKAGVDGLTIYQETYNRDLYKKVHLAGQKADYDFRLDTPERGCKAGFRSINIGALFGLGNIYEEVFAMALHAQYLMNKYLECEISISLPRMNLAEGGFQKIEELDDVTYVQFLLAFRIFMPRLGINISTREHSSFRDSLIGLGVTKFSAGSNTAVGGYTKDNESSTAQFEISDDRSAKEIFNMIKSKGYQPLFKDWEQFEK